MLLDEHGAGHAEDAEDCYDRAHPGLEQLRVEAAGDVAQAAEDVHAREDVRRRVGGPDDAHYPGAEAVYLHVFRPQVLAVRHEHVEDKRSGEGYHEVYHPALEGRAVLYQRGDAHGGEERIPDYVEHGEAGHEGYVLVYGQVGDPIALGGRVLLDDEEGQHVYGEVQHQPGIFVRRDKAADDVKGFANNRSHSL